MELNPVRAGLVRRAEEWRWSSAAPHCGGEENVLPLDRQRWQSYRGAAQWQQYLAAGEPESDRIAIRQCTHTGRPFGDAAFVESLEQTMQRRIRPRKRGRVVRAEKEPEPSLAFEI